MNQSSFFTLYEYRISPFCIAVRIALDECNASFISRSVNLDKIKTIAFLKKSTFGKLPVLVEHHPSEEIIISESKSILIFISERFPKSTLGFATLQFKIQCISWLNFIYANFIEQIWNILSKLYISSISSVEEKKLKLSFSELQYQMTILNKHLSKRAYLAGDYSIADIIVTPFLDLLNRIPLINLSSFIHIESWKKRIQSRSSYKNAWPL
jgi:glutathione S-transferase